LPKEANIVFDRELCYHHPVGDFPVPITKISEIVAKEHSYSTDEVEWLKAETTLLLNGMESSQAEILSTRSAQFLSPTALEIFFRSRERNEKIGQILQFLLTFMDHLPAPAECGNKMFNPIEQFRECVLYAVDLLLEADVKRAVFNKTNRMGSPEGDNVWDYQGRINEKHRELHMLLITGASGPASLFLTLCRVLEQLCLFWFDVKQGEVRRIRRSDIYMYIMVRILLDRFQQTHAS
jgi:hypothetical protein